MGKTSGGRQKSGQKGDHHSGLNDYVRVPPRSRRDDKALVTLYGVRHWTYIR